MPRVAVIGLDGVPHSMLRRMMTAGIMPNLKEAAGAGTLVPMASTIPAISSVAWTSFMTGKNPGDHGIYGFTDLEPDRISLRLPSFDDIKKPVLWHRLAARKSIVINLPFTYPARPLHGVLVSGFVAPVFERAVFPASLISWLKSIGYQIDVDAVRGRHDRAGFVAELFSNIDVLERAIFSIMDQRPWDLFIGVVTGTDRLNHFLYDAQADASHPFHERFVDYYRRVDRFFGGLMDRVGHGTRLIVLSDHGFTDLKQQVYLNHILKAMGYLAFNRPDPRSPGDIHPSTKAFAMDPTRIYLNSKDRFQAGVIGPGEAREIRGKLKGELERLRLSDVGISDVEASDGLNDSLFAAVLCKEDLYTGDCFHLAPDLVIIPRPGYDPKAALDASAPVAKDIFTGMHTHDDAFLLVQDRLPVALPDKVCISDVADLILEVLE